MAKSYWRGASRISGWLAALVVAGLASAQAPLKVRYQSGIEVDGELREAEWGTRPDFKFGQKEQVWQDAQDGRRSWGGKADLSAAFYLRYDAAYLYFGGWVKDDHHIEAGEGEYPESADAIELFLDIDPDPEPDGGANPGHRLTEQDVQLFLLPLAGKWIRRPWDNETPGRTLPPTGSELTGMQLEARRDGDNSYTFEARIPFHNFLDVLGESVGDIGFHLALDDRDPDSRVPNYMTLDGNNPTYDTRSYRRLKFVGRAPLSLEPETGMGLGAGLMRLLPWVLVGLFVLVTLRLFARRAPMLHMSTRSARLARVLGVVLLLVGLGLPGWLADNHASQAENRLANAVEQLEKDLPQMEQGTLKSYVGEARDEPLLAVLQGEEIQRKQFFSYQFLTEMVPRFGTRLRSYHDDFFRVRPYWIPLPDAQPQLFAFKRPLDGGRLAIVLSEPTRTDFLTEPIPMALRLSYRLRDKSEDETAIELLPGEKVSAAAFGKANREMFYVITEIPGKVESLSLTALGGDQVQLVGLTVVPTDADALDQPLSLGQPLGEIESDLRGIYPEDAGFELLPYGNEHAVTIPEGRQRTFHKMWFVYCAAYPGEGVTPDLSEGDDICQLIIKLSKGDDRVIPLEHQRSMFYELASRNSDVPEGVPAVQVEVGSAGDSDDQDKRINVVYLADLNLPRGVTVQAIHFKNTGPYPIRFRSVIFGSERRVKPSELANSPLQLAAGKALLKKDHLDQLRDMHFAVYRNGSLARSSLDKAGRERRAVIPAAVRKQRLTDPGGTYRHTVDEGDARVFGGFLPMQGDSNVVLGVWAVDSGFGHQLRFFSLLGAVLSLLSAPFLLLLFNDALGWLSNLRLRLMVVVSVAA
ncbi:MAG: sugar-binding protein, partial [Planctomycetota bacterium]|nr:sugar-binding protein [Planctomycetota bacterium]